MALPPGLLPEGLRDRLPPEAAEHARIERALLDVIASHGYDLVTPPLAEFEEGIAGRLKSSQQRDLARFIDPLSQRMLAIRPDITPQIGRIVASQLAGAPRPLRLAYAGPVLKLKASQLAPERQATQVGAELVGSDSVAAVRELVRIAVEALARAGVAEVTVDLTLPDLVETLTSAVLKPDRITQLQVLLDMKDAGGLVAEGFADWLPLIAATGPVGECLGRLRAFDHAGLLSSRIDAIEAIAAEIGDGARVTMDPTERHGFEYQSWFGFSAFATGSSETLGRGGSYRILHADGREEAAAGFTLYPDPIGATGKTVPTRKIYLPVGTGSEHAAALRADGWRTIAGLSDSDDGQALGCSHRLTNEGPAAY